MCRLSRNLGALTSRAPQGHVGLSRGYFTFTFFTYSIETSTLNAAVRLFSSCVPAWWWWPHYQTSQVFLIYFPKLPRHTLLCSKYRGGSNGPKKASNCRWRSPQDNQMGPRCLPEMPQAIDYSYSWHKKKSPHLHGSHMKWVIRERATTVLKTFSVKAV
jgi:hypothetical protein